MKKTATRLQNKYFLAFLVACLLLPPFLLKAETSSVYNEIITNTTSGNAINTNKTTNVVEVTNTTIINGERSEYHYATSSTNPIEHDVTIINNSPTESKTTTETFTINTPHTENVFDLQKLPEASTNSTTTNTSYKMWSEIENVLKYLYFYVEQLF